MFINDSLEVEVIPQNKTCFGYNKLFSKAIMV
jgi:hypothetical protein